MCNLKGKEDGSDRRNKFHVRRCGRLGALWNVSPALLESLFYTFGGFGQSYFLILSSNGSGMPLEGCQDLNAQCLT